MGMNEYEQLFATNVHQKLKTKVRGKIYVEINWRDELYVRVINSDDIKYEYRISKFSERFLNGWSTDYATYEIVNDYKKFIFKQLEAKYFYND